ncbi:hypothetical protein F4859DRAFT_109180 [Xylaria cf. heliscus]|nr:hypothetical protein F4859DRAFT_109180 [Xylaria cf. heliscus]
MMDSVLPSRDVPSSPWAARFPMKEYTYASGDGNHSMLAPEAPRIDNPKYYDQNPILAPNHPPPTPPELDKLFFTETAQRTVFHGMPTWQAAALNRHVRFSPESGFLSGGHRPTDGKTTGFGIRVPQLTASISPLGLRAPIRARDTNEDRDLVIYLRERIKVDETRWFPFLRKGRWYDWIEVSDNFQHLEAGETWTVDNPSIWDILRTSIELVYRMLEALIKDKHEGVTNNSFRSNRLLVRFRRHIWPTAKRKRFSSPEL